jgi:hypothetical protein
MGGMINRLSTDFGHTHIIPPSIVMEGRYTTVFSYWGIIRSIQVHDRQEVKKNLPSASFPFP